MAKSIEARYVQELLNIKYTYAKKWYEKRQVAVLHTADQLPYDGSSYITKIQKTINRWLEVQPYDPNLEKTTIKDEYGYPFEYPKDWLIRRLNEKG